MKTTISTRGTGRWSEARMLRLAAAGVAKFDLLGERGTTLCIEEFCAHAVVVFCDVTLNGPTLA